MRINIISISIDPIVHRWPVCPVALGVAASLASLASSGGGASASHIMEGAGTRGGCQRGAALGSIRLRLAPDRGTPEGGGSMTPRQVRNSP